MNNAFAGKVALITGGTAGIGKAAAQLFAQAGASVVIAGRRLDKGKETEQELQAAGGSVLYVQTDVSEPVQVTACVRITVERFGRLDYAFNNAAALSKLGRTGDFLEEDFDLEITSNLKSVWLCMKAELEQMEKQQMPGGAIVNTSSVNGLGGARGASLYSMSKAGVLALTKSAAQEYAPAGIRVNALVAGWRIRYRYVEDGSNQNGWRRPGEGGSGYGWLRRDGSPEKDWKARRGRTSCSLAL